MKILHVGFYDNLGGAAKAMMRIHNSLSKLEDVESKILVISKFSNDESVFKINNFIFKLFNKLFNQLKKTLFYSGKVYVSFNHFNTKFILKEINESDFDIVNLHWIGGEMISIDEIMMINKNIVWTFHDMWPFLGIHHYEQYKYNLLNKSIEKYFLSKKNILSKKKINIIFPSTWMKDKFFDYDTFKENKSEIINYPINSNFWKRNKLINKYNFVFHKNRYYLLFLSNSGENDHRKGFSKLKKILSYLREFNSPRPIELLFLGSKKNYTNNIGGFKINFIKRTHDETELMFYYSGSDITLILSDQDNLPLVMQESLACGTPVIAFRNGGMKDLITDNFNGFIVDNKNYSLFSDKIIKILKLENNQKVKLRKNSRSSITDKCDDYPIGQKTRLFYQSIIKY